VASGSANDGLTRREMLAGSLLVGTAACAHPLEPASDARAGPPPMGEASASALARAIREGQLSSEELVRACLDRIAAVDDRLNAVVQVVAEDALARARTADAALKRGEGRGPLHGVPMTVKDSFDTAGVVTTGGTKGRAGFVPREDATVVRRLKQAGAILLGKTNTPELTLGFETSNLVYGRTSNPYDLERTPGGSSGGAAAIVAAGGSPFDVGSDYGGSIRLPCHFCGLAGLKPTMGRVPRTGHVFPFGGLLDSAHQIGPIARWVEDLSLLLPLLSGPDFVDPAIVPMPLGDPASVRLPSLRIAFHTDNGIATPTAATRDTVRAAADLLAAAGAEVDEARPAGIEESFSLAMRIYFADGGLAVRRLLDEAGTREHTLAGLVGAAPLTPRQLDAVVTEWYALRSRMSRFLEGYDVVLGPVNAQPAMLHGTAMLPENAPSFSYTMVYNLTGWPAVAVRAGSSPEGLPIGVQLAARPAREDVALAVAAALEDGLGGFRPPALG